MFFRTEQKLHGRPKTLDDRSVMGAPDELTETLNAYREAGVDEFILPDFHLGGGPERTEFLDRFMEEVAAPLRD